MARGFDSDEGARTPPPSPAYDGPRPSGGDRARMGRSTAIQVNRTDDRRDR
jgi:hypothetical protein